MPPSTAAERKAARYLSTFYFLYKLPYTTTLSPIDSDRCLVCHDPYDMRAPRTYTPGAAHNFPVRLSCGHITGIQCLARWMLSEGFGNRCMLCCAKIMRRVAKEKNGVTRVMSRVLVALGEAFLAGGEVVREDTLDAVGGVLMLNKEMREEPLVRDRVMLLCEVFLDHLESAGRAVGGRAAITTQGDRQAGPQAVPRGLVAQATAWLVEKGVSILLACLVGLIGLGVAIFLAVGLNERLVYTVVVG